MPIEIELPVSADRIRTLRTGDLVTIGGRMLTGREAAHRRLATRFEPAVRTALEGRFLYHCGPVVSPAPGGGWRFVAFGPSASAPVEPWEPEVIARYGVRGVLGKGGMGEATRAALRAHGAAYLQPAGGLAVTLARCVVRVHGVHLLDELGVTDAIWDVEVSGFPAIVAMDARAETHDARGALGASGASP